MAVPSVVDISSSNSTQSRPPPSSHRLPTVSASVALLGLERDGSASITTGLPSLDGLLSAIGAAAHSGIQRGRVTELWGPSGAGKTTFALQVATQTLSDGGNVKWLDATTTLNDARVEQIVTATQSLENSTHRSAPDFGRAAVPTLSHLLALVLQPPPDFFQPKTRLLVVDGFNCLVDLDYPRYQLAVTSKTEQQKWKASRRYAVLGSVVSALNKSAVINNLAVIVTTGCSTRSRTDSGLGAALVPGIGGAEWESGIWNRLVIFQDFSGRFIGLQKCQGKSLISKEEVGEVGKLIGFNVLPDGMTTERTHATIPIENVTEQGKRPKISPVKTRKRTLDEIADSESEDVDEYGWAEADDAVAAEGLVDESQVVASGLKSG